MKHLIPFLENGNFDLDGAPQEDERHVRILALSGPPRLDVSAFCLKSLK